MLGCIWFDLHTRIFIILQGHMSVCVHVMVYLCVVWVCLKHICGPCVHACRWVCVHVSGYVSMSVGMCPCQWVCVHVSGYVSMSVGMCPCQWVCVHVSGYVSMSVGMCPCQWVCVHVSGYVSMSVGMCPCQWLCVSRYLQLRSNSVFGSLSLCLLNTLQDAAAVAVEIKGPLVEDTCGNSHLPNHVGPTGLKITDNRLCVLASTNRERNSYACT